MVQDHCIQGSDCLSAVLPLRGAALVTSPHHWGALGFPPHTAPPSCTHTRLWKGKEKKRMLEKPIPTAIKKQKLFSKGNTVFPQPGTPFTPPPPLRSVNHSLSFKDSSRATSSRHLRVARSLVFCPLPALGPGSVLRACGLGEAP